ncbi:hypothetical protein BASA50_007276 [Batrachochytrium salamandrivorans]|uniref:Uncharacterized protein n=1 Tax=Batrachochytrium salamandrivorans TaxID=1357716 RepID=A0ABQ8F7H4_9FUNG|nr:hypothetical protein BASA50_007276 [Batrachochytrium salamandrivorans]
MKLISFAIVSFLAITVSAQPPSPQSLQPSTEGGIPESYEDAVQYLQSFRNPDIHDTPSLQSATTHDTPSLQSATTQDTPSLQIAATQDKQESQEDAIQIATTTPKDIVQDELNRLEKEYEKAKANLDSTTKKIDDARKKERDLRSSMQKQVAASKRGGNNQDEEAELRKNYFEFTVKWKDAVYVLDKLQSEFKKVDIERDDAKERVQTLKENHKRLKEHNDKGGVQLGLSYNSYYNKEIMKEQSRDVCQNAKTLVTVGGSITKSLEEVASGIGLLIESKEPKLDYIYSLLFTESKGLTSQIYFASRDCEYTKKLQKDYKAKKGVKSSFKRIYQPSSKGPK